MNRTDTVQSPQSALPGRRGRCDITPPIGIYHRMWGAAIHDRATAVHRPLEATLLWLEPARCTWRRRGTARPLARSLHFRRERNGTVSDRRSIAPWVSIRRNIQVTLTHTHGSGWMSRQRSSFDGGELIGPYLDELCASCAKLAVAAQRATSSRRRSSTERAVARSPHIAISLTQSADMPSVASIRPVRPTIPCSSGVLRGTISERLRRL